MAYLDQTVTGKLHTGRDIKRDKEIGNLVVTLTRNTETAYVDGNRLPYPRVELRLRIEVFRDGNLGYKPRGPEHAAAALCKCLS